MIEIFELIKKEILVVLVGATPVFELRGAIPLGITLGFSPLQSTMLSVIGNIIPIPILLKILDPLFSWLSRTSILNRFVEWLKLRTIRRSSKVKKYSLLGLFLLVAIPLPTTGAYTGCIAATIFNIDYKKALVTITGGVLVAAVIVFLLSYQATIIF